MPVAYQAMGEGETALVFVHGWSCDRTYWAAQTGPFSQGFRVVTVDLAGHGESGAQREDWTISAYGADVAAVVVALDLSRVILIGHSLGGDVVVSAARLLGDRVAGLVWVDDYSRLGRVRTAEEVTEVMAPFRAIFAEATHDLVTNVLFPPTAEPALRERVAQDMSSAPPHIAIPSLESSITNDRVVPTELAKLRKPVISLNPSRSEPDIESLAWYGVGVLLVPEVGHFNDDGGSRTVQRDSDRGY